MTHALITLHSPVDRARAARMLADVPPRTRVEFKAPRRSLPQNDLLWGRLTDIARQLEWYGRRHTAEDWKTILTASLRKADVVPGIDPGTVVPLGMRTSDMSTAEMTALLDLISMFAAESGVKLTDEAAREAEVVTLGATPADVRMHAGENAHG